MSYSLINSDVFGFSDEKLEKAFVRQWLQGSLVALRVSLILAGVLVVSFMLLDRIYFDPATQVEVAYFRVFYMGPMCLLLFAITFSPRTLPFIFHGCVFAAVTFSAYFCVLAVRLDEEILSFLFPMLVEISLFLFILLRVPFQLTLLTAALTGAICVYTFANMPGDLFDRASYLSGMMAIFVMMLVNVYEREVRERTLFMSRLRLEESEQARSKIEQERQDWYRNFASFVRHEVNNQMVGVQSSLDMMERVPEQRERYHERAAAALKRMRSMVNEAADATSIDAALEVGEIETANLSDIVGECVEQYVQSFPEQAFETDIQRGLFLCGQPFRLFQLLDKLITNAQQHAKPGTPIRVKLTEIDQKIVLTVENEGDALPEDTNALFGLWHTNSKTPGRHGLGLYVVSRIAQAHGGRVRAEPLAHAQGARLVVEFERPRQRSVSA